MSACAMLTYGGATPAAWACAKEKAASFGVTITTNTGSATVHGFTVAWNYNPDAQTASIQCTDSPFWAPCSVINSKINDQVEQCLQQNGVAQVSMIKA